MNFVCLSNRLADSYSSKSVALSLAIGVLVARFDLFEFDLEVLAKHSASFFRRLFISFRLQLESKFEEKYFKEENIELTSFYSF